MSRPARPACGQPGAGSAAGLTTLIDTHRRRAIGLALRWLPFGAAAPLVGSLAACGLDGAPRTDYHLLRDLDDPAATPANAPRIDKVLLLAASAAPTLYDTDRMVFSADGRSRSYFQYGFWAEPPSRSLLVLAERRLARAGLYRSVALSTSGVRGDLLLTLRLDELCLDDAVPPGQARLIFNADLLDWRQRSLLSRRRFARSQAVVSRSASGLAQAASQATTELLNELVAWAASGSGSAA